MAWNHQVRVNQPRCLLHRYNKSTCSKCFDICNTQAISFETELVLDATACTSCMLCTSVCPTDALTIEGFPETKVVNTLAKAEQPVLACSEREELTGHSLGPCLGYLSPEHFAAYQTLIGKPIQLNLTQCNECPNSHITEAIERRVIGFDQGTFVVVTNQENLDYEEISYSRRNLLGMLGIPTFRTNDIVSADSSYSSESTPGFADKTLPPKLHILNLARESCQESGKPTALNSHYFTVTIDETCDGCGACIAMCPTGALVEHEGSIQFIQILCTGCGLCVEFCPQKSIELD